MKYIFAVLAIISLSACQTIRQAHQSAEQVMAQVCPPIEAVVSVLSVPGAVDPVLADELAVAAPTITAVCHADQVALADLDALRTNTIPTLIKIINESPLQQDQKQVAVLSIAVAQAALGAINK